MTGFDLDILWNFDSPVTKNGVFRELESANFSNVVDDDDGDSLWWIAEAMYSDYERKLCNYHGYVHPGMDLRAVMEFRKSAVLIFPAPFDDFHAGHTGLSDPAAVKDYRIHFIQQINPDYHELGWQYWMLISYLRGIHFMNFDFDFESCFSDCNQSKVRTKEDYWNQFIDVFVNSPSGRWNPDKAF